MSCTHRPKANFHQMNVITYIERSAVDVATLEVRRAELSLSFQLRISVRGRKEIIIISLHPHIMSSQKYNCLRSLSLFDKHPHFVCRMSIIYRKKALFVYVCVSWYKQVTLISVALLGDDYPKLTRHVIFGFSGQMGVTFKQSYCFSLC